MFLFKVVQKSSGFHWENVMFSANTFVIGKSSGFHWVIAMFFANTVAFLRGILVRQQFHLNKGYTSPYCSTTGRDARGERKYSEVCQVYQIHVVWNDE